MRRITLFVGSALVVFSAVTATTFAASLGSRAAPTARDLPRVVTASTIAPTPAATSAPAPKTVAPVPRPPAASRAHPATPSQTKAHASRRSAPARTSSASSDDPERSSNSGSSDDEHEVVTPRLHESDGNKHGATPAKDSRAD